MLVKETPLTKQDLLNTVVFWVHGGGVEYVDGRSLAVWSFGSVLNLSQRVNPQRFYFAVPKDCTLPESNDKLREHIISGFINLQKGAFDDGSPIAGQCKWGPGALLQLPKASLLEEATELVGMQHDWPRANVIPF